MKWFGLNLDTQHASGISEGPAANDRNEDPESITILPRACAVNGTQHDRSAGPVLSTGHSMTGGTLCCQWDTA